MSTTLDQAALPMIEKSAVHQPEKVDRELLAQAAGKPAAEAAALARAAYTNIGAELHAAGTSRYVAAGSTP